jgi:hypothetical protein
MTGEVEEGMAVAAAATAGRREEEELREDGGREEAERAAAVGREEELEEVLEEEGGEMEQDADSWVESSEWESEEGGRAKDTLEDRSNGDTAKWATTESIVLVTRGQ